MSAVKNNAEDAKARIEQLSKDAANRAEQLSKDASNKTERYANDASSRLNQFASDASKKTSQFVDDASNKTSQLVDDASVKTSQFAQSASRQVKQFAGQSVQPKPLVPDFSLTDYGRMWLSGGLAATASHGALVPADVVKTRLQLEPAGSKLGMVSMARNIVASEGPAGLMTGFGPTAVGYLIQGGTKFCGFEAFKRYGVKLAGSEQEAQKHRTLIYIGGASLAELIASTFLTPLEAARIRLVSDRGYAKGLASSLTRMASEGGFREFYAGYIPILLKQIPFTQAQFTINEFANEYVKKNISEETVQSYGKAGELSVSLSCGLLAGIGAAIASHPADTLLSKINKGGGGKGGAVTKLVRLTREAGFMGLWAGLGPRIVMQGGLICVQMALYDQIKRALHAPPSITISKPETSSA